MVNPPTLSNADASVNHDEEEDEEEGVIVVAFPDEPIEIAWVWGTEHRHVAVEDELFSISHACCFAIL
jgi:hypothetical protein